VILFYDTETTGLPDWRQPSDSATQPHIVQLAILTCDEAGGELDSHNLIVRPDGWTIPEEVTAIHGISQDRAMAVGIPEAEAVEMWLWARARAALCVAHNESFDARIMRIAMLRAGVERAFIERIENCSVFCTCTAATPIVNLPPSEKMAAKGMMRPKPPKLTEAIQHFFGEELPGAHDAMVDVRACARIFFHMKTLGVAA